MKRNEFHRRERGERREIVISLKFPKREIVPPARRRINDAARWMHSLIWFREAIGKEQKLEMVREWNTLYPGAPVSLKGMYAMDKACKSSPVRRLARMAGVMIAEGTHGRNRS